MNSHHKNPHPKHTRVRVQIANPRKLARMPGHYWLPLNYADRFLGKNRRRVFPEMPPESEVSYTELFALSGLWILHVFDPEQKINKYIQIDDFDAFQWFRENDYTFLPEKPTMLMKSLRKIKTHNF